jgi:hypothetical protein
VKLDLVSRLKLRPSVVGKNESIAYAWGGDMLSLLWRCIGRTSRNPDCFKRKRIRKGDSMKRSTCFLAFAVLFTAVAVCIAADDANIGTWKLDEAKSKIGAGAPKNTTVVYEATGDSIKVTVDGVGADGKPSHSEWTGKYDGKDYPVTGDPTGDMRSYKRIDARTLSLTNKKDGKVTLSGKITVASDGKSRTVVINGKNADGKKFTSTAVYNKQ